MALHRDIYWVGRQWAVTGTGIQACDQKQKGKFDIEAARLWEDGALESVRALQWLNPIQVHCTVDGAALRTLKPTASVVFDELRRALSPSSAQSAA